MPLIPEFMRLAGDEDGGVSLDCYHSDCDPFEFGTVAYYGDPMATKPSFTPDQLGAFLEFITQHAASHLPTAGHLPPGVKTPARQSPQTSPAGEPVKPPVAAGKEPTPGSAVADLAASRESTGAVVFLGVGAGQSSPPAAGACLGGLPVPGAGAPISHDPDREGAGGWPPGPPPHPRPPGR